MVPYTVPKKMKGNFRKVAFLLGKSVDDLSLINLFLLFVYKFLVIYFL